MFKMGIIGDIHFNYKKPTSRIDDYVTSVFEKLDKVRADLLLNNITDCFILGDVFHSPRQPIQFINRCISELSKFNQAGITLYSIIGNHDLMNERMDWLEKTPIYTLYVAGVLRHISSEKPLKISLSDKNKVLISCFDYTDVLEPIVKEENYCNICIAHRYYNLKFSELSLNKTDLDDLGYDVYILGHDHENYPTLENERWKLIRPGSLTRGTATSHNITRKPCYSIIEIKEDIEGKIIATEYKKEIDCPDGSLVFSENKIQPKNKRDKTTIDFENIINRMKQSKTNKKSIYDYLESIEMEKETKKLIECYLTDSGFIKEN